MHILREPSFSHTNKTKSPKVRHLVEWSPYQGALSISLLALSTLVAILYGWIDIGRVSRRISLPKSISFLGGTPLKSGKTFGTLSL